MSNDLLHIVDIDHEGRGVAKKDEKTFFIHNALIDEKVEYKILKKKKKDSIIYSMKIQLS